MLEFEKTYLAKRLPDGLTEARQLEIEDFYIPAEVGHPKMCLRRQGDKFTLAKKVRLDENDASKQEEHNLELTAEEFKALCQASHRDLRKVRHYLDIGGQTAEIDVFEGLLKGLVLVNFEFATVEEQEAFVMPDFCLADVTQEDFLAGSVLAGQSYADIEVDLRRFGYERL